jgi:hypothetical protein
MGMLDTFIHGETAFMSKIDRKISVYHAILGEESYLLNEAVEKALIWMEYQCPSDRCLVAQQSASDWRDEQWVTGYGLFVNTIVDSHLRLIGQRERTDRLPCQMIDLKY